MTERNLARVRITPEAIEAAVKSERDMPDDASLVDLWLPGSDSTRRVFTLIFESDEYDGVLEAGYIPETTEYEP